jgi:type II secretory pathway pseudopilin PulG
MIKKKYLKKKGFTLIEVLVSMAILITFFGLITRALNNFTFSSNTNLIKSEMDMDLRKSIERLEREISPARNIVGTALTGGETIEGVTYNSNNSEILFQVPAYDSNNQPLYETTSGQPQVDLVSIKMTNGTENITIRNPETGSISMQKVKKLQFSFFPVAKSRRPKITSQSIFEYYIPIDSSGSYLFNENGTTLRLFSFFGENNNEITDPNKFGEARTIKITLLAQRNYGQMFMSAKRETEIRLRNSTY